MRVDSHSASLSFPCRCLHVMFKSLCLLIMIKCINTNIIYRHIYIDICFTYSCVAFRISADHMVKRVFYTDDNYIKSIGYDGNGEHIHIESGLNLIGAIVVDATSRYAAIEYTYNVLAFMKK